MLSDAAAPTPPAAALAALRRLRRTKNHRYRRIGDEGVVVLIERGEVLAVTSVGAFLLELWSEENTTERAVQQIVETYAVEREVAFDDVVAFATDMVALGVLEEQAAP